MKKLFNEWLNKFLEKSFQRTKDKLFKERK